MGRQMLYTAGTQFGHLTIIERTSGNRALCCCDCGNVLELTMPALLAGKTDCGHVKREQRQQALGIRFVPNSNQEN